MSDKCYDVIVDMNNDRIGNCYSVNVSHNHTNCYDVVVDWFGDSDNDGCPFTYENTNSAQLITYSDPDNLSGSEVYKLDDGSYIYGVSYDHLVSGSIYTGGGYEYHYVRYLGILCAMLPDGMIVRNCCSEHNPCNDTNHETLNVSIDRDNGDIYYCVTLAT